MEQEFEKILNILDAERLKPNIHFVSLYVLYYECLKDSLVDLPKSFFCNHIEFKDGTMHVHESDAYKEKVRKLDKHIENASFKWFVSLGAVSEEEYSTFEKLRKFRNKIVHELLFNLNEGFTKDEVNYLVELIVIYRKIEKWWIVPGRWQQSAAPTGRLRPGNPNRIRPHPPSGGRPVPPVGHRNRVQRRRIGDSCCRPSPKRQIAGRSVGALFCRAEICAGSPPLPAAHPRPEWS